ncbi:ANK1, partial [Symbiodinium sp. CCMP2456]
LLVLLSCCAWSSDAEAQEDIVVAAAEAVETAKAAHSGRRPAHSYAPPDVSSDVCWVGDYSKDQCCQGDSSTHADCWDDLYSYEECCPNADCWDGSKFTYAHCCDLQHGPTGHEGCWSGDYTYEHCCLANRSSQSWVDIFVRGIDTDQFYGMDEFYTDAQYGGDFGYYSTGRVLGKSDGKTAQEFAHYTTYPMALSPHF